MGYADSHCNSVIPSRNPGPSSPPKSLLGFQRPELEAARLQCAARPDSRGPGSFPDAPRVAPAAAPRPQPCCTPRLRRRTLPPGTTLPGGPGPGPNARLKFENRQDCGREGGTAGVPEEPCLAVGGPLLAPRSERGSPALNCGA